MPTLQRLLSIPDLIGHQKQRQEKIKEIETATGRPLIVYAAKQTGGFNIPNSIDNSDITGFADLVDGIDGKDLDVFLDSPGGQAEATERLVNLLRQSFENVRFLIPHSAYSAATMFALSGDEILMDDRSTLGPIDPQIFVNSPNGGTYVPAQDILEGFKQVRKVLKEEGSEVLPAYLPMIDKYDLYIFEVCKNAERLSTTLVKKWLQQYMLRNDPKRKSKADKIAKRLADHKRNLSHGRSIGIQEVKAIGINVNDLRDNSVLRAALWELYCLIELYFDRTPAVKLFENSKGVSWARNFGQVLSVQMPPQAPPPPAQAPLP